METRTDVRKNARISSTTRFLVDYSIKPKLFNFEIIEHPNRSDLAVINTEKIIRMHVLPKREKHLNGTDILKRLKATGRVLLDARVLEELIKKPDFIPKRWKERNKSIYFFGTIFEDGGNKYVLYLYFNGKCFPSSGYASIAESFFEDELFAMYPSGRC